MADFGHGPHGHGHGPHGHGGFGGHGGYGYGIMGAHAAQGHVHNGVGVYSFCGPIRANYKFSGGVSHRVAHEAGLIDNIKESIVANGNKGFYLGVIEYFSSPFFEIMYNWMTKDAEQQCIDGYISKEKCLKQQKKANERLFNRERKYGDISEEQYREALSNLESRLEKDLDEKLIKSLQ